MGQAFCPPKGNFIFQYLLFRGDFAVGFREGKTFRVIQTMHYYNGNPSRKTIDDSSQNRSPSKFHDHSCRFFSTIPSIKPSKRIPANWNYGTSTTQKNANGFFWGEDDTVDGLATRNPVLPTHQFEVEVVYPIRKQGHPAPSNRWLGLGIPSNHQQYASWWFQPI